LLVFDWDGTLVDSTQAISRAMQYAARDLGLDVPSDRQASHVIGLGLHEALRLAVPGLPSARLPEFVDRYRHHYLARDAGLAPFEGIDSLLVELRHCGAMLAVATGKSRAGLDRALDQMQWRPYFESSRCADEGEPKPHPWMLRDLCDELEVAAEQVVMVGDTTHDLSMAKAAGCRAIAVTYGAHPRDVLLQEPSVAVVDHVPALREALLRCLGRSGALEVQA
jgi:phosphoglycolate phosphatase